MKRWLERHPLSSYFIVAYAVSWSIAVPLALQAQGVLATHLPWSLHYLTLFGPAISAFVIARLLREPSNTNVVRQPVTPSIVWWAVGFGSPLLLFVVTQIAARVAGQTPPTWTALGRINFVSDLGAWAWGLWFITSCGEELGWRGFALPRLQRTHSAMTSTLLLSLGWAGWHLPAFFYLPSYAGMGLAIIPGFFLGILAGAIVLTWLYNSSGGSVLAAALWHGSFNFVTASPSAGGLTAAVTSTLVMVWAAIIAWRSDWSTLAKRRTAARSVRASREEQARTLPGDALIADSIGVFNHAITIGRPRRDVWPWLAQMGAGTRAGWYSYDVFDNGRQPSADRVIPALQTLTVGMIFPALPGVTDGFTVLAFEAERFLVLGWVAPDGTRLMTWAFVLDDCDGGATRLIVRARGGAGYTFQGLPWWAAKPLVTIVHFVMQRKQLHGIARRVEQCSPWSPDVRSNADMHAALSRWSTHRRAEQPSDCCCRKHCQHAPHGHPRCAEDDRRPSDPGGNRAERNQTEHRHHRDHAHDCTSGGKQDREHGDTGTNRKGCRRCERRLERTRRQFFRQPELIASMRR
jgi:uncharacterized protein